MDIAEVNENLAEVKAIPLEVLNLASLAVSEVFKKLPFIPISQVIIIRKMGPKSTNASAVK